VALFSGIFTAMSVSKTTVVTLDMDFIRMFPGCAELALEQNFYTEQSDGKKSESKSNKKMMLYKLYPDYDITFASGGCELFGHKEFLKEELATRNDYKQIAASKNISDFNKQSYKKLHEKVTELCESLFPNGQDNGLLQTLQEHFEYATKGLIHQELSNDNATYKGWTDMSGKLSGYGYIRWKNGNEYIGEWKNSKQSGIGKLIWNDGSLYTGEFLSGKFHGSGIIEYNDGSKYDGGFSNGEFQGNGKVIFANGDAFEGTYKKGERQKGKMLYANRDRYDGEWKYNKKTKESEKHGNGTMVYANGEIASGKWKNNEFITKK